MGCAECTDPLIRRVGAPRQRPLFLVASYVIYADVPNFR